jgi:hypothetical protein
VIGNAAFMAEAQGIRVFTVSIPPRWRKSDAEALQYYFPERDFVPLMEVLATVNRQTGWMEEFPWFSKPCLNFRSGIYWQLIVSRRHFNE